MAETETRIEHGALVDAIRLVLAREGVADPIGRVEAELMAGALAGGPFSQEIIRQDPSGLDPGATKLFLALDIAAFVDPERFSRRVEDLVTLIQAIEPGLSITLPGGRGWQARDRHLAEGIPIHPDIAASLQTIGFPL